MGDDRLLIVKGRRVATSDSSRSLSEFSQRFSLNPTVNLEKFTATLNNGVLVVSAPKELDKLEENVRRIPISSLKDISAENNDDENKNETKETIEIDNKTQDKDKEEGNETIDLDDTQ